VGGSPGAAKTLGGGGGKPVCRACDWNRTIFNRFTGVRVASLAKFYFPTRYRLDDTGIMVKTMTQTLKKEWTLYRSCYPDKNGILLSPFAEPSRLENFRGLYLMFDNNRDDVTAFCRSHIGKQSPVVLNSKGSELRGT
jgi:hypothetical protein